MYQVSQDKEWDTDLWQKLMMHKRIAFSKTSVECKGKLVQIGALPHFENNYDWAMLCIAYCFATGNHLPNKLQSATELQSGSSLEFTTLFQKQHQLWLAYISDALFEYKQTPCNPDDLYKYIQDLWHTGALLLWKKWEDCRQFKPHSLLEAKQVFLRELADLAKKNSGSRVSKQPENSDDTNELSVQISENQLKEALKNMNLGIKQLKFNQQGVREDIYRLSLNKYVDLARSHDELCSNLGMDNKQLRIKRCTDGEANSYEIFVQRPKNTWRQFGQPEFQAALKTYSGQDLLPICLGFNELGEAFFADLAIAPHVMIGGTTGSGKSVFVRSVLHSLFALNDAHGKLEVAIADGKSMDFQSFEKYPNLYQQRIFVSPEEIATMLNEHLADMETRKSLCKQYGVSHVADLPNHIRPPYRVIVVDELAYLKEHDKNGEMESALVQLTAQARATGIYLILCTQRPDSTTFKGQLRTNTPSRIALKVGKSTESKIILDETGAEKLSGRGDHLVKWTEVSETVFLHGFNV